MGVHLEKYSRLKSIQQGIAVHRLTANDFNSLNKDPDRRYTARRYDQVIKSIRAIGRIASSKTIDAYIIREKKHSVAIGLATIIFDQTVVHPDEGMVTGNNLDYWLTGLSSTEELHKQVAENLVLANGYVDEVIVSLDGFGQQQSDDTAYYPAVFVAVQTDSKLSPLGFTQAEEVNVDPYLKLIPLGEPRELTVPEGQEDKYGIAAVGRVTQLYYRKPSQQRIGPHISFGIPN